MWTNESPVEIGHYWYREDKNLFVVEIYKHSAYFRLRGRFLHRDAMAYGWRGEWWPEKIEPPEDSE